MSCCRVDVDATVARCEKRCWFFAAAAFANLHYAMGVKLYSLLAVFKIRLTMQADAELRCVHHHGSLATIR